MSHIITNWLNESSLSLRAIAKKCKVTYASFYNVIAGKTRPSFKVMEGIKMVSNDTVTPNDWLDFKGAEIVSHFVDVESDNDNNYDGGHVDDNQ